MLRTWPLHVHTNDPNPTNLQSANHDDVMRVPDILSFLTYDSFHKVQEGQKNQKVRTASEIVIRKCRDSKKTMEQGCGKTDYCGRETKQTQGG